MLGDRLGAVVSAGAVVSGAVRLWGLGAGEVGIVDPGVEPGDSTLPEEGLPPGLMPPLGSGAEGSTLGEVVSPGAEGWGEMLGVVCGSNDAGGAADSRGSETEGTAVGCSPPGQRELRGVT